MIAIDVGVSPDLGPVNTGYQVALRSMHITYYHLSMRQAKEADILIHPDVDRYGMFDDHVNQEMYEAGKAAALQALPEIQKRLREFEKKSEKPLSKRRKALNMIKGIIKP